jgi:hypothetical protein
MALIRIEQLEISSGSLVALIEVTDPDRMRTSASPGLPERALASLPGLARHRCENDAGVSISRELRDTETAHLLEHVACELMALSGSPRTLRGETRWDFAADGPRRFRISLEFDDDFAAIGALGEAADVVEGLFGERGSPDVAAIVERLRQLRETEAG